MITFHKRKYKALKAYAFVFRFIFLCASFNNQYPRRRITQSQTILNKEMLKNE